MATTEERSSLVDRAWDVQERIEQRAKRVGKGKYGRVLRMARKPDQDEFVKVSKITSIGILVLGILGFGIYWLMTQLPPLLGL